MTEIHTTLTPDPDDVAVLRAGMREFELSVIPDLPDETEDIAFYGFVRGDAGRPVAGIKANVFWNGVEVDMLWVAPERRGGGLGSRLLAAAEGFGRERGAVVAYLKTVAAAQFDERRGYTVFGVLEDRPLGSKLLFMQKRLDGPAGDHPVAAPR